MAFKEKVNKLSQELKIELKRDSWCPGSLLMLAVLSMIDNEKGFVVRTEEGMIT